MDRFARITLVLAALLALPALAALAYTEPAASARGQSDLESGGIGLDREAWEAIHGPGEVGQSLVTYEGGTYAVGFEQGAVVILERSWEAEGNVDPAVAAAEVADLLPADAELVESFFLPATEAGPVSLLADRYESRSLAGRYRGGEGRRTEGILVLYQQVPAEGGFAFEAARVSITVGSEPPAGEG